MPADLRQKISIFVTQYKKHRPAATDIEIIAPFISMSYTLSPVPELADPVITSDLPGSLLDVMDFPSLVREFYRRSGISAHIDDYAKAYQRSADATLRPSARQMIGDLLDYLHTRPKTIYTEKVKTRTERVKGRPALERTESRERERRFFIVPELLAPNGVVSFLNVRDDYYVVLPPDTNLTGSEAGERSCSTFLTPSCWNMPLRSQRSGREFRHCSMNGERPCPTSHRMFIWRSHGLWSQRPMPARRNTHVPASPRNRLAPR